MGLIEKANCSFTIREEQIHKTRKKYREKGNQHVPAGS